MRSNNTILCDPPVAGGYKERYDIPDAQDKVAEEIDADDARAKERDVLAQVNRRVNANAGCSKIAPGSYVVVERTILLKKAERNNDDEGDEQYGN